MEVVQELSAGSADFDVLDFSLIADEGVGQPANDA
jgi:hypothetical protein